MDGVGLDGRNKGRELPSGIDDVEVGSSINSVGAGTAFGQVVDAGEVVVEFEALARREHCDLVVRDGEGGAPLELGGGSS